jgi:adenylyl cyclase-associated protein
MDDIVVPTIPREELTAIIHRLEAATSRLEDMAAATIEAPKLNGAAPTPAPTGALPPVPVSARAPEPPKPLPEVLPESVEEFDTFLAGPLKKFVNLSDEVGGPVAEQVGHPILSFHGGIPRLAELGKKRTSSAALGPGGPSRSLLREVS